MQNRKRFYLPLNRLSLPVFKKRIAKYTIYELKDILSGLTIERYSIVWAKIRIKELNERYLMGY